MKKAALIFFSFLFAFNVGAEVLPEVISSDGIEVSATSGSEVETLAPPSEDLTWWERSLALPWPVMSFILGLVDGFNPCAMWSLLILIGFLLSMEDLKKRWLIGGIFIASSGIIYSGALFTYLFGFTHLSVMMATSSMSWFYNVVGVLACVTGAQVLWSAKKVGIECRVRSAESRKKFADSITSILARENIWLVLIGVIALAFSVNAIELLCSFAIPTTFTATLVSAGISLFEQISAIAIYIIAYMLDDTIVFCLAMWTLSPKVLSSKWMMYTHAIGGLILLLIGLTMLLNPGLLALLMA